MKAKFDKIMANFVDENNSRKPTTQTNGNQSGREKILDFKNNNL